MNKEELIELQIKYSEGLIDEELLREDIKDELKNLYKKQIEEKNKNLNDIKEKLERYLKNKNNN